MEIKLHKDSISYFCKTLSVEFSQEETAENIVPDTLPDVDSVIDADASVILRGKDVSDGRISINGILLGFILYRSESENELRRMPVQLPFTAHWENNSIEQHSRCITKLAVSSFEARIINSRKLLLRAEMVIAVDVYNRENCEYTAGTECDRLEILEDIIHFGHLSAVGERTFNISESAAVSSGKPLIDSIVKYRVKLECGEVKAVGSRIVMKGNVSARVLYKAAESRELCSADFSVPFSQIYDTDCSEEICGASAQLMLTGVYIEADNSAGEAADAVRIELSAAAQFLAWSESVIECVCDAYSTQNEITMVTDSVRLKESGTGKAREETALLTIATEAPIRTVIDAYVCPGKRRTDGTKNVWPSIARVIYADENGVVGSISSNFEITNEADVRESNGIMMDTGSVSVKQISGAVELNIPVRYDVVTEDEVGFATPVEITIDENAVKDIMSQPSVIVVKADGNTSLWGLAKQFNTTIETIHEANPDLSGKIPEKGELLLIAKKR